MFNTLLRTIIAVYLQLCVLAWSRFFKKHYEKKGGQNLAFNGLFLTVIFIFCIGSFLLALKPKYASRPTVIDRIGTLYAEV